MERKATFHQLSFQLETIRCISVAGTDLVRPKLLRFGLICRRVCVRDQRIKGSRNEWRPLPHVAGKHLQLVYSAPIRVRLPPINFEGDDARQWIEEVAVYFLRDRINRDKLRQAQYLSLIVDNGTRPSERNF
jgi:hypothetical protein